MASLTLKPRLTLRNTFKPARSTKVVCRNLVRARVTDRIEGLVTPDTAHQNLITAAKEDSHSSAREDWAQAEEARKKRGFWIVFWHGVGFNIFCALAGAYCGMQAKQQMDADFEKALHGAREGNAEIVRAYVHNYMQ